MARRKTKKIIKETYKPSHNTNPIAFGIGFIFLGFVGIISKNDSSKLSEFFNKNLIFLFGENFIPIFSFTSFIVGVYLLLSEKKVFFDFIKLISYFLILIIITSFVGGFYDKFYEINYFAFFNFYNDLKPILGGFVIIFIGSIILSGSIFAIFRISIISILRNILMKIFNKKHLETAIDLGKNAAENLKNSAKFQDEEYFENEVFEEEKVSQKRKGKIFAKNISVKDENLEENEIISKKEELKKQKEELNNSVLELKPQKIEINKKIPIHFGKTEEEKVKEIEKQEETAIISKKINENFSKWQFPSLDLLKDRNTNISYDETEIKRKAIEIQEKLLEFKIEVNMKEYVVGPTVVQYKLMPKEGIKLQKIVSLKDDLALALSAKSIRIQAPIPGKGLVGIEIPNPKRQLVSIKELASSKEFKDSKYNIPLIFGRNVNGENIVADLTKMPHMLVAGQTASGKSVGINGFLLSMLYKFSPSDLKLILIDPKVVELSVYNGIPHLLTPVITSSDKALNSLKWGVAEMQRRYDLLKKYGVRNFEEYKEKEISSEDQLPYLVFVIDELADLMMDSTNRKEVEACIARLAQKARACGIFLIIATQRPSVNVLTGIIKANIPSRVSFTVASGIDSRTILDTSGADELLGMGDMLFLPAGQSDPERIQGVFVEVSEVENLVNYLKLNIDPEMLSNLQDLSISNGASKTAGTILENYNGNQDEDPEIIEKAIQIIREENKGSTSLLQRKLGLGYARAAKILDILEELGVVGPSNGSKPREVFMD